MNTTYILGAGASHCYTDSYSGIRPPLASQFFSTYTHLPISEDFDVRVGDIINYVRDVHGIPWQRFDSFNMNVEAFMTELDERVRVLANVLATRELTETERGNFFSWIKAYDQMIFLFAHVLNETQNGPVSKQYNKLVSMCDESDTLITLNWDTLLDRALYEDGRWIPDSGYDVNFRAVLDKDWRLPSPKPSKLLLLKLHGSTNWLVNYVTRHFSTGERIMVVGAPAKGKLVIELEMNFSPESGKVKIRPETRTRRWGSRPIPEAEEPWITPCCFLSGPMPFSTYKDRYRPGYDDFSYFFPPNDPDAGIPLMPLLVPPTKFKLYDEFKHILDSLWEEAAKRITTSKQVVIIGYSFPPTDNRIAEILRPLVSFDTDAPIVQVVNPTPDNIYGKLTSEMGIKSERVKVVAHTFDEYLQM